MQNRSKQQEVLYEILLQMLYERSEVISVPHGCEVP